MLEELKDVMREMLADDELFTLAAQGLKKSYDALIAAGFTTAQAAQIVASQGQGFKTTR